MAGQKYTNAVKLFVNILRLKLPAHINNNYEL